MKPDKHKQKKQNEYKRKHGIQNKTGQDNQTKNKEKQATIRDLHRNDENTSTDNEQAAFNEENRELDFSTADEEEIETGEDLNHILRDTANTLFQYQYGNKNSFFEEVGNYSKITEKYQDIVSVHPGTLSDILLGLPLYKRLDLQEDIFEPEEILKMQAEANMHLKKSELLPQKDVIFSIENEEIFTPVNVKMSKPQKMPIATDLKLTLDEISTSIQAHQQPIAVTPQIKTSVINKVPLSTNNSETPANKCQKTSMAELEDELDALLLM